MKKNLKSLGAALVLLYFGFAFNYSFVSGLESYVWLMVPPINNKNYNFTEGWFSGFTQSDGCFTISFEKRKTGLFIRPKPIFVLTQDISELELFKKLQQHLAIGYITKNKINVSLYVTSLSQIEKVLFPIFDKHPLKYGKLKSYLVFKQIVNKMLNKEHLKLKGLLEIIDAGYFMNKETSTRTAESKENLIEYLKDKHGLLPTIPSMSEKEEKKPFFNQEGLTLDFVTGLIDGDGSFNVSFQYKPYRRVRVNFTVVQETSSKEVLNELKTFFGCGNVYDLPSSASYQVENVDLILNNIVPKLNGVIFNTQKSEHYETIVKVSNIIKTKGYKSDDALKEIIELAYDTNKLGKRRRLDKQEFIEKIIKS